MIQKYQFEFSMGGEDDFFSLPKVLQKRITAKLFYFQNSENPLLFAKKILGFSNRFRFRIGDYRVITEVRDHNVVVILLILKIGHRREVYE